MHAAFTTSASNLIPVHLVASAAWDELRAALPENVRAFAETQDFTGNAGQKVIVPDADGAVTAVLYGLGDARDALAVAGLSAKLTEGDYTVDTAPEDWPFDWIAAGWTDGAYRFDRYLKSEASPPRLKIRDGDSEAFSREAEAADLLRDLINTPAADMGPDGIEAAIQDLAKTHKADVNVVSGGDLLDANYPMIHAVGRAATIEPRFIELSWGDKSAPVLALVGKGVAFDSGGLNIKTGDYMRIMKKDMGGAAHVIALAALVMGAKLPVRLKLYVPAVENAIAGNAFRPGDILQSRKGLTVEIDNTDAEGRLVLGDALARACEAKPDLIMDFATLTGAARVALGPDLAPYYTDAGDVADGLDAASKASGDPLWRMPLWEAYLADLKSPIADLVNSGGRMAGSITAALFLKQFVGEENWVHFDVWGWRNAKYGRPAGGAPCGLRAAWAMLRSRYL